MPRASWSGAVSFGMVTFLYPSEELTSIDELALARACWRMVHQIDVLRG